MYPYSNFGGVLETAAEAAGAGAMAMGHVNLGTANLQVAPNQLEFFGFEDPEGIDKLVLSDEVADSVSQLDNLRFETEAVAKGEGNRARKGLVTSPASVGDARPSWYPPPAPLGRPPLERACRIFLATGWR